PRRSRRCAQPDWVMKRLTPRNDLVTCAARRWSRLVAAMTFDVLSFRARSVGGAARWLDRMQSKRSAADLHRRNCSNAPRSRMSNAARTTQSRWPAPEHGAVGLTIRAGARLPAWPMPACPAWPYDSDIERSISMSQEPNVLIELSNALADAVETVARSIVTVKARRRLPATGLVWSPDGLIVTANHIVERDEDVTVVLPDGSEVAAELVGRDPSTDVAALRVEASDLRPAPKAANGARPGQIVLALGRPYGSAP